MNPTTLLPYYPTYNILDEVVSSKNYKNINIFIDLKNNLQTTFLEFAVKNIIENSKASNYYDTSIFSSVISFLGFHKLYALKRGLNINFYIFFETGQSYYHIHLHKDYKKSRHVGGNLFGLDLEDRDLFKSVLYSNFLMTEKALNRVPNVFVVHLQNLEADFVPYYLIKRKKILQDENTVNLIYSTDHDLYQCVDENTFVFFRHYKTKKIIKKGQVLSEYLKIESDIPDEYLPFAMSIIGDSGDDIDGIKGIAAGRFIPIFNDLKNIIGDMTLLYKNIEEGSNPFSLYQETKLNKNIDKIIESEKNSSLISRNMKLVSFELLSRKLDNPDCTEIIDKKKKLLDPFKIKEIVSYDSILNALVKNHVILEEESLNVLYYGS